MSDIELLFTESSIGEIIRDGARDICADKNINITRNPELFRKCIMEKIEENCELLDYYTLLLDPQVLEIMRTEDHCKYLGYKSASQHKLFKDQKEEIKVLVEMHKQMSREEK